MVLAFSAAIAQLKERAEREEPALFTRYDFRSRSDFFKLYQRLSSILVRDTWDQSPVRPPSLWHNKQAKHPLPDPIARLLLGTHH